MPRSLRPRTTSALRATGAVIVVAAGCVGVSGPRFEQNIATALADQPMSRIETPDAFLYYPTRRREQALRFLERVEGCVAYWRNQTLIRNYLSGAKLALIMPEVPLNNAFVAPRAAGYEDVGVIPTYNTLDFFTVVGGLPPDPAFIGCHEVTHYVQFQQIGGFAAFLNLVLGDIYSPQVGLDPWFDEGLAVYSETILQPGAGRLAWPFWNGVFGAGVAGRRINGGDLSAFNRVFEGGNQYLIGSQFVRFLAERYGEARLWKLIDVQGRSIFFPLLVNVRFWQAYDKSLSTLIDEFADATAARYPRVQRPGDQRIIREAGSNVRYARARDGTEAFVTADLDLPTRVEIYAPDGRLVLDRALIDVLPPRDLKVGAPHTTGGISFSADGRQLYFAAQDNGVTFQATRLIHLDVTTGALSVASPDLKGSGGSISPDGRHYLFARAEGDRHDLAELDLETGAVRTVVAAAPQRYFTGPRYSPDGRRIVATLFDGRRFGVVVLTAAEGRLVWWAPDAPETGSGARMGAPGDANLPTSPTSPTFDGSWVDDDRIVFLGAASGSAGFQVYLRDLTTGVTTLVTHAPYLAFNPQATADGTAVRFLNREGWRWTLDQVPLAVAPAPPPPGPPAGASSPPSPTPVAAGASGGDAVAPPLPGPDEPPPAGQAPSDVAPAPEAAPPPPRVAAPLAPPPGPVAPPPVTVRPLILGEEAYSGLDHLFVPQLHALSVANVGRQGLLFGAALDGGDRLSFHRWQLFGYGQPPPGQGLSKIGSGLFSGGVGYSNQQLAPFTISMLASQYSWRDVPERPADSPRITAADFTLQKKQRSAWLSISRLFYENPVQLSALVVDDDQPNELTVPRARRRLAGASLSASYTGVESTPYTDARRLVFLAGSASYYPREWGTLDFGLTDLRGQLFVTLPLPLSRRHTLSFGLRGRELVGAPDSSPILQVGGGASGFLFHRSDRPDAPDFSADSLPPGVAFFESLRGYEDFAIATTRAATVSATYRYPIVIDWGSASTLGVLPAFFLRQLNFELFFSGAVEGRARNVHAAAGSALGIDFALLLPWSLQYQFAQRLEDDQARVHALLLGTGW